MYKDAQRGARPGTPAGGPYFWGTEMSKRIVVALGGNALGSNLPEQMQAVKNAVKAIADLIEAGNEVVVSHGNGPQVGMIKLAMDELADRYPEKYGPTPLSVCVAMSQGYIGYDLQNALREELSRRGLGGRAILSMITQVEVSQDDPAFENPSKPIGRFLSKEEADREAAAGNTVVEDAGRGYRRVVASPEPVSVIEIDAIRALLNDGQIVISGGGGGIPVFREKDEHLRGAAAVIDKDAVSALLAKEIDADVLVILTAVEKVAVNYGKPDQRDLDEITVDEAKEYMAAGEFAPGSMLPKVEAAVNFASSGSGRQALITLLEKAAEGIEGKTGTRIVG